MATKIELFTNYKAKYSVQSYKLAAQITGMSTNFYKHDFKYHSKSLLNKTMLLR